MIEIKLKMQKKIVGYHTNDATQHVGLQGPAPSVDVEGSF